MHQKLFNAVRYFKRELVTTIQTYGENAGLSDICTKTIAVKCKNVCLFYLMLKSYGTFLFVVIIDVLNLYCIV